MNRSGFLVLINLLLIFKLKFDEKIITTTGTWCINESGSSD